MTTFNIICMSIMSAAILPMVYQLRRPMVSLTTARWQIVLMSHEYLLPTVMLFLLLAMIRKLMTFGMSLDVALVPGFLLFAFYMMRCFMHKGALISLPLHFTLLEWCLDARGRLHPHLAHGLAKHAPGGVLTLAIMKQWRGRIIDAIKQAGVFGRTIVIKTPFGLDRLCAELEACGWRIERFPDSTTPWPLRITLTLRRRGWKNRAPWHRIWRDVGVIHHAILHPALDAAAKPVPGDSSSTGKSNP